MLHYQLLPYIALDSALLSVISCSIISCFLTSFSHLPMELSPSAIEVSTWMGKGVVTFAAFEFFIVNVSTGIAAWSSVQCGICGKLAKKIAADWLSKTAQRIWICQVDSRQGWDQFNSGFGFGAQFQLLFQDWNWNRNWNWWKWKWNWNSKSWNWNWPQPWQSGFMAEYP